MSRKKPTPATKERDARLETACRSYRETNSTNATAKATGIPQRTVYKLVHSVAGKALLAELAAAPGADARQELASAYQRAAGDFLRLSERARARLEAKIDDEDASAKELAGAMRESMVCSGIAADKAKALGGRPEERDRGDAVVEVQVGGAKVRSDEIVAGDSSEVTAVQVRASASSG